MYICIPARLSLLHMRQRWTGTISRVGYSGYSATSSRLLLEDFALSPAVLKQLFVIRWRTNDFLEVKVWAQTEQMTGAMVTFVIKMQRKTDRSQKKYEVNDESSFVVFLTIIAHILNFKQMEPKRL